MFEEMQPDEEPVRWPPRKQKSGNGPVILIGILIGAALVGGTGVVVWMMARDKGGGPESVAERAQEKAQQKSKTAIINALDEMASKIESTDLRQSLEDSVSGGTQEARDHAVQVGLKAVRAYQKHTSALIRRQVKLLRDDQSPQTVESIAKILDSLCSETLSADVLKLIDSAILDGSPSDRELALSAVRGYRMALTHLFSDAAKQVRQLNR